MKSILQILLILKICQCFSAAGPTILSTEITVLNDNDFINHIIFEPNQIPTKCSLEYKKNEDIINVPLSLDNSKSLYVYGDSKINEKIKPIRNGICGFVFSKYTKSDPTDFKLIVDYTDEGVAKTGSYEFKGLIYNDAFLSKNSTILIEIGKFKEVICDSSLQLDCKIYNPLGELVFSTDMGSLYCKYSIEIATMADIGLWKCINNVQVSMNPIITYVDAKLLTSLVPEPVTTWYEEKDGIGKIGCKYTSATDAYLVITRAYCSFTTPANQDILVTPGLISDRYSTLGTNLDKKTCEIKFNLPLLENEIGAWMCKINPSNQGGFIYTNNIIPNFPKYIKKSLDIKHTEKFDISCNVPYTSDNCYITSPTGEIYLGAGNAFGVCKQSIDNVTLESIGNWTCHFARPDSPEDDIITTEIIQLDVFHTISQKIEADELDNIKLECKSGLPIKYCRFVDPRGKSYTISPQKSSNDFKYFGKGLDYGDCGIEIKKLNTDHMGIWKCIVRQGGDRDELAEDITIEVIPTSGSLSASGIGIAIGVMAAAMVILSIAIYKKFVRKTTTPLLNSNRVANSARSSNSSNSSNEIISRI